MIALPEVDLEEINVPAPVPLKVREADGLAPDVIPEVPLRMMLLVSSKSRLAEQRYTPGGKNTVPPVDGNESMAAWIANVSSVDPSPVAPYALTSTHGPLVMMSFPYSVRLSVKALLSQ